MSHWWLAGPAMFQRVWLQGEEPSQLDRCVQEQGLSLGIGRLRPA